MSLNREAPQNIDVKSLQGLVVSVACIRKGRKKVNDRKRYPLQTEG